jgi:WD40 repeat protein
MSLSSQDVISSSGLLTERAAGNRAKLDAENPWPGLDAYGEDSRDFFKGRETEAAQLLRLIRLSALTVVYSKSGLGKTSLLEAGLFPLLRAEHFLPVYLRLDFSGGLREPLAQAMQCLKDALKRAKAEFPKPAPNQTLWEYLHRKNPELWSADNYPLTPVLVFDQFEELFSRSGGNVVLIKKVFDDLADLIENRIPAEVAAETAGGRRSQLDLMTQHYRIVLSFREDFLPEMRTWEKQVPSLLKSYLRLEPLSRAGAIKAVEEAGKVVLESGIAERIVDFVGKPDASAPSAATVEITIEPVLLSLCCTQLNRRRAPGKKIDWALLEGAGEGILEKFYRDALEDPEVKGPPELALFIEDKLIQGGFRGDYPKQEALDEKRLTEKQLTALTDRLRLLRIVSHADTARVELIHDRLVPVIGKIRDERLLREREAEQERKALEAEAERDKERARSEELRRSLKIAKRNRNIATVAAVASFIVLAWGLFESVGKQRANRKAAKAAVAVEMARLAEGRLALGPGVEPLEQTMYRGLAAYRLTDKGMSQAASLTALHWVLQNSGNLRKAVTIRSLMPTPALSYSPDGKNIAVGGEDGLIRLLDGDTYRELGQPLDCHPPHGESVWSLSFNGDGKRLAAGYASSGSDANGSGLVCVFDVSKDAAPSVLKRWSGVELWGKQASIYSVAYGSDAGKEFVVSGGSDKILRVLDVKTGEARATPVQNDEVVAVAVSGDGRLIASGGGDAVLRLWRVDDLGRSSPKPQRELSGHEATIQQVQFLPPDSSRLVSAGDDGRIIVWNVKRACPVQESKVQKYRIYGIAMHPDGELVAAASGDGSVRLFSIAKGDSPCLPQKAAGTTSTVTSPKEFDVIRDGTLAGHEGLVLAVAWNADGTRLASTGQEGSIRIWGPANIGFSVARLLRGSDARSPLVAAGKVTKVAISPDGRIVVAGDDQGFIHVWDRPGENNEPVAVYEAFPPWSAHQGPVTALAYIRMGGRVVLVSGGEDGRLRRWEVDGKPVTPETVDDAGPIRSVAVSPDGKMLAAGSSDGVVLLWDVETGALKQRFEKRAGAAEPSELYTVSFTEDGKHLAVGDSAFVGVLTRDLEKGGAERMLMGHGDTVKALARGSGKWLLSAGRDGSVLEWEQSALTRPPAGGLKKQDEFRYRMVFRNQKALTSMDVNNDGSLIVTGAEHGQVQLWDGVEHVLIGASFLRQRTDEIQSVAMAADGSFFVTADAEDILVWPGPAQWADMICSKLGWNMSNKQWREWVSSSIPYQEQCPGLTLAPD